MKIAGIITEYNPFHNGHAWHVRQIRDSFGADAVVAVMSGHFVQRGGPSLIDKWSRARMALCQGVDLVIELPVAFACSSAETFATGSVSLLQSCGCINQLIFGSESGQIHQLNRIAEFLKVESAEYKLLLKEKLKQGYSFPAAREWALRSSGVLENDDLKGSNNILGVEYLKASKRLKTEFSVDTILRIGNQYRQSDLTGEISSATAIRNALFSGCTDEALASVPVECIQYIESAFSLQGFINLDIFSREILYRIIAEGPEGLSGYSEMEPGLAERVFKCSEEVTTVSELISRVSTKRYAQTRIRRLLTWILLGQHDDVVSIQRSQLPPYIRILGSTERGHEVMRIMKKHAEKPVFHRMPEMLRCKDTRISRAARLECTVTDIYMSGTKHRKRALELTMPFIRGGQQ